MEEQAAMQQRSKYNIQDFDYVHGVDLSSILKKKKMKIINYIMKKL